MRASIITFFSEGVLLRHTRDTLLTHFFFDVRVICEMIKSVGPQSKYGAFRGRMQTRRANRTHLSATGAGKIAAAPNWQKRDALMPQRGGHLFNGDYQKERQNFVISFINHFSLNTNICFKLTTWIWLYSKFSWFAIKSLINANYITN